jgi:hypothetical protein
MSFHGLLLGIAFTFFHVNCVRTLQETHLWASTACYSDTFTFLYVLLFVLHRKHAYGPPRPVNEISLRFIFS